MRTTYYTTKEWKALSIEFKKSLPAGSVTRVTRQVRGGTVRDWAVTL